jgi:hypothetical protein
MEEWDVHEWLAHGRGVLGVSQTRDIILLKNAIYITKMLFGLFKYLYVTFKPKLGYIYNR